MRTTVVIACLAFPVIAFAQPTYQEIWTNSTNFATAHGNNIRIATEPGDRYTWVAQTALPNNLHPGLDWEVKCFAPDGSQIYSQRFDFPIGNLIMGKGSDRPLAVDAYNGVCFVTGTAEDNPASPDEMGGTIRMVTVAFRRQGNSVSSGFGNPFYLQKSTGGAVNSEGQTVEIDVNSSAPKAYVGGHYSDENSQGNDLFSIALELATSSTVINPVWSVSGTSPKHARAVSRAGEEKAVKILVRQEGATANTPPGIYLLGNTRQNMVGSFIYSKWNDSGLNQWTQTYTGPTGPQYNNSVAVDMDIDRTRAVYSSGSGNFAHLYIVGSIPDTVAAGRDWVLLRVRCQDGVIVGPTPLRIAGTTNLAIPDDYPTTVFVRDFGSGSHVFAGGVGHNGGPFSSDDPKGYVRFLDFPASSTSSYSQSDHWFRAFTSPLKLSHDNSTGLATGVFSEPGASLTHYLCYQFSWGAPALASIASSTSGFLPISVDYAPQTGVSQAPYAFVAGRLTGTSSNFITRWYVP